MRTCNLLFIYSLYITTYEKPFRITSHLVLARDSSLARVRFSEISKLRGGNADDVQIDHIETPQPGLFLFPFPSLSNHPSFAQKIYPPALFSPHQFCPYAPCANRIPPTLHGARDARPLRAAASDTPTSRPLAPSSPSLSPRRRIPTLPPSITKLTWKTHPRKDLHSDTEMAAATILRLPRHGGRLRG